MTAMPPEVLASPEFELWIVRPCSGNWQIVLVPMGLEDKAWVSRLQPLLFSDEQQHVEGANTTCIIHNGTGRCPLEPACLNACPRLSLMPAIAAAGAGDVQGAQVIKPHAMEPFR